MASPYQLNVAGPQVGPSFGAPVPPMIDPAALGAVAAPPMPPAPDASSLPNLAGTPAPLPPHLDYLQSQMSASNNSNQAIESAMNQAMANQNKTISRMGDLNTQVGNLVAQPQPQIPGPAHANPVGWDEAIPAILGAVLDPFHAGEYAGAPFAANVQHGLMAHDQAVQQYGMQDQQRQQQMENVIKELGLTSDQAAHQGGLISAMIQRQIEGRKLDQADQKLVNDHLNDLWGTYDKLQPGQRAPFLAMHPEMAASQQFSDAASQLGPSEQKDYAQAFMDKVHAGHYSTLDDVARQKLPFELQGMQAHNALEGAQTGEAQARAATIPADTAEKARHDQAEEGIGKTNAGANVTRAGAAVTTAGAAQQNANTNKLKITGVKDLATLQHQDREAAANLASAKVQNSYWLDQLRNVSPSDSQYAAIQDKANKAQAAFAKAVTAHQGTQQALAAAQTPLNPGNGPWNVSGTIGNAGTGTVPAKVKMPTAQGGGNIAALRQQAQAAIQRGASPAEVAARFKKLTGKNF